MNIVQEQEKQYAKDNTTFEEGKWWVTYADGKRRNLAAVQRSRTKHCLIDNSKNNCNRMWVDNEYIPKTHPLHKAGRYKSFNDAAFSSFTNYSQSTKGDVYIITNSAWPEWIKVGKAIDATDRLKSYQTGDPHRSYSLRYSVSLDNRHTSEIKAHKALELISDDRRNEWFRIDLSKAVKCLGGLDE